MTKRRVLIALSVTIASIIGFYFVAIAPNLGGDHTQSDQQRYGASPQYDPDQGRFVSSNQATIDELRERVFNAGTIVTQLSQGEHLRPEEKLPEATINLAGFLDDSQGPNIIWLGHSSFMMRMDGKTILIDPVFANAGPVFFVGQRFQASVLSREDLPEVDYVLITHDHYDHLEAATTRYLAESDAHFIVPIGIGAHLRKWGIREDRFTEKLWWQEFKDGDLLIATVPSEHYSGRRGFLANDTLWASFVIKGPNASYYFSGDSGYGDHFAEIGDRYGPFDLSFMENGQYNIISREVHMHPEDVIDAFQKLNSKVLVPIHWAMFSLARHSWYEPAVRITALAKENGLTLFVPRLGEMISRETRFELDEWWIPIAERQKSSQ